jgi:hypothetical protein
MPKFSMPSKAERPAVTANGGAGAAAKAPLNTKMIGIIGGGIAAVILIIVLVMTLGGGGDTALENNYRSNTLALALSYPTGWTVEDNAAFNAVSLQNEAGMLLVIDATPGISNLMNTEGMEVISATETLMATMLAALGMDETDMPALTLQKTGDYVSGGAEYVTDQYFVKLQA